MTLTWQLGGETLCISSTLVPRHTPHSPSCASPSSSAARERSSRSPRAPAPPHTAGTPPLLPASPSWRTAVSHAAAQLVCTVRRERVVTQTLDETRPSASPLITSPLSPSAGAPYRHVFCILCIAVGRSELEQLLGKIPLGLTDFAIRAALPSP